MSTHKDKNAEPVAWQIKYEVSDGTKKTVLLGHNAIGDYRLFDANAVSTPLYAAPQPQQIAEPESQVKQKTTGNGESARVADYNRGWNDCLFATSIERAAVNHKEPS